MNEPRGMNEMADAEQDSYRHLLEDYVALKRSLREAKEDRDRLRKLVAEMLHGWRRGKPLPLELDERASALVRRYPVEDGNGGEEGESHRA
jgi:hypothetical protein